MRLDRKHSICELLLELQNDTQETASDFSPWYLILITVTRNLHPSSDTLLSPFSYKDRQGHCIIALCSSQKTAQQPLVASLQAMSSIVVPFTKNLFFEVSSPCLETSGCICCFRQTCGSQCQPLCLHSSTFALDQYLGNKSFSYIQFIPMQFEDLCIGINSPVV